MVDVKQGGTPVALPHSARGFEGDDFAIEFMADKIVFMAKSRGEHYTLHFGPVTGVMDLHRTWVGNGGTPCHETLFAIRHADLAALLYDLAPAAMGMTRLIRRLRVGWMHRRGIGIVHGLEPITDEQIAAITTKRPGRKRLMLVEEKFTANIQRPEYLDDVWDFPDGPFSLFDQRGRVGVGFKTTDRFGQARLHWVKLRDLHRFSRAMVQSLCAAAARYALRREQYAEYDLGSR
jgi:hypothetical protein